jgi:hypothetical protein
MLLPFPPPGVVVVEEALVVRSLLLLHLLLDLVHRLDLSHLPQSPVSIEHLPLHPSCLIMGQMETVTISAIGVPSQNHPLWLEVGLSQ